MEMKRWTNYGKYLVLVDKAMDKFNNVRLTGDYYSYLDFEELKGILEKLANSDSTTYTYNNTIYRRKITSTEAKTIHSNLYDCKWVRLNNKIKLVASQVGIRL